MNLGVAARKGSCASSGARPVGLGGRSCVPMCVAATSSLSPRPFTPTAAFLAAGWVFPLVVGMLASSVPPACQCGAGDQDSPSQFRGQEVTWVLGELCEQSLRAAWAGIEGQSAPGAKGGGVMASHLLRALCCPPHLAPPPPWSPRALALPTHCPSHSGRPWDQLSRASFGPCRDTESPGSFFHSVFLVVVLFVLF